MRRGLGAAFTLLALCGAGLAQEGRGGAPGAFDFYVLALSWSPGFCAAQDHGRQRAQCDIGAGLGFVVHGLWPQNERGYPTECGTARTPSRIAVEGARGLYPDEGLARFQWRRHGTCSGKSPTDYYADVRKAREAVKVPAGFQSPDRDQTWTPVDLERAFVAANPGLRADMVAVACRGRLLQEVRICFQKDLRGFRSCPEVDRSGCRTREITVKALR